MQVNYIVTSKYLNGDDYSDKFQSLDEAIEVLQFINSDENNGSVDENNIDPNQVALTTEEA